MLSACRCGKGATREETRWRSSLATLVSQCDRPIAWRAAERRHCHLPPSTFCVGRAPSNRPHRCCPHYLTAILLPTPPISNAASVREASPDSDDLNLAARPASLVRPSAQRRSGALAPGSRNEIAGGVPRSSALRVHALTGQFRPLINAVTSLTGIVAAQAPSKRW